MTSRHPRASTLVLLGLLPAALLALAALGTRFGLCHYSIGLRGLLLAAAAGALVAFVLAFWWRRARVHAAGAPGGVHLLALVLALAPTAYVAMQILKARSLPLIHDISTDLESPPVFRSSAIVDAPRENALRFDAPETAELQRQAYPDVQPLVTSRSCEEMFARAYNQAVEQGWDIAEADPGRGYVEATATTFWFGFRDDVVVRLRTEGDACRVDMRSISRVGLSDVGANAERIRTFLSGL